MKFYFGKGSESGKYHLHRLVQAEGEGGGQGGTDWKEQLPEGIREWDEVKNSDTPEKFWDQMTNQRSRMGRSITVPGEDAGKDQWDEFHTKLTKKVPNLIPKPKTDDEAAMNALYGSLGRPEKAEDYKYDKDENDKNIDYSLAEQFKVVAHKQGLNTKQYNNIVKSITKANVDRYNASITANKEAHKELATEWGAEYDRRMSLATTIAKLTDAPPDLQNLFKSGNASPASYKWLYNVSQKFKGEGTNLMDDVNQGKTTMTPEEASQQILEIRGNKEHPYWNKQDPGNKAAMAKMSELYKLKNAG